MMVIAAVSIFVAGFRAATNEKSAADINIFKKNVNKIYAELFFVSKNYF
jgi:hypothetical protein